MKSARWWKEDVRDDVVKNEGAEKRRRAAALGALLGCWAALRPFSTMGPAETSLTNLADAALCGTPLRISRLGNRVVWTVSMRSPSDTVYSLSTGGDFCAAQIA